MGSFIVVLGAILLSLSGSRVGFHLRHLLYALLSASCFGLVVTMRKLGLAQAGPLFGSAVTNTGAPIVFTAFPLASGQRHTVAWPGRNVVMYCVGAGVAEHVSVCLTLLARRLDQVSLVTPLAGTAPLEPYQPLCCPMKLQGIQHPSRLLSFGERLPRLPIVDPLNYGVDTPLPPPYAGAHSP